MTHKTTRLDVITDLRRALSASFSEKGFSDRNFRIFFEKAERNLESINLNKRTLSRVSQRLSKAKNVKNPVEKRREDILVISSLI